MEFSSFKFIGCDTKYEDSKKVIFGAPFDGTTSFKPGTRFGPSAVRESSVGLEVYSPYQNASLEDAGVADMGNLEFPFGNIDAVLKMIEDTVDQIVSDGKIPLMIGGEHLVSLGAVRAIHRKYRDLKVVHFDAHTDLRDDYLGEKFSHASVIRRVWDLLGDGCIYQLGIRSGDRAEFEWAESHVFQTLFDFGGLPNTIHDIGDSPVYLTIDLDVMDPSVFPGTGTPEAGGVSFKELLDACMQVVKNTNIVGLDVVELAPCYDLSGCSSLVASKLIRELLIAV